MLDSLYIAATGLNAQQANVDVISNNLANVNTPGFKKGRVSFEDLLYRDLVRTNPGAGARSAAQRVGAGVSVSSAGKVFTLGDVKQTSSPLDLAIRGGGFFEVLLPDGTRGFTRSGAFQVNSKGQLATADGNAIEPAIQIPADAASVLIDASGKISARLSGQKAMTDLGQIELANFVNPAGLKPVGDNVYLPTETSGDAMRGKPGEDGLGGIAQGFLESSNVKLIEEMVNLIVAQRAYEINSKVIQASDEMLGLSNNLRR